jgi:hypothetical protein
MIGGGTTRLMGRSAADARVPSSAAMNETPTTNFAAARPGLRREPAGNLAMNITDTQRNKIGPEKS